MSFTKEIFKEHLSLSHLQIHHFNIFDGIFWRKLDVSVINFRAATVTWQVTVPTQTHIRASAYHIPRYFKPSVIKFQMLKVPMRIHNQEIQVY